MESMLNSVLRHFGYYQEPRPLTEFLAFKETFESAKAAGLSAGDYIDSKQFSGPRSPTDQTIDGMAALGVFDDRPQRICEIGPGSGRYLERTIAKCQPRYYEIYETAAEWRDWLVARHGVIARKCDGRTLAATESASIALIQSHKLFPALPFLNTVSYFQEMARVVQDGGWVVFDVMTESCFSPHHMKAWLDANPWHWPWSPHLLTKDFTLKFFTDHGIDFIDSFPVPLYPAITECMVFRKKSSQAGLSTLTSRVPKRLDTPANSGAK